MTNLNRELRVILIGGTSHVGKSTLAESLALKLGWSHISSDKLARHPGRPWKTESKGVPKHVAEHYLALSVEELFADVFNHYTRLWPDIKALITAHATDVATDRMILEGSALSPPSVAGLHFDNVGSIWLTASNDLLQERIHHASGFSETVGEERVIVQKFLDRTLVCNELMMDVVNRLGLVSLDVQAAASTGELSEMCLDLLDPSPTSSKTAGR